MLAMLAVVSLLAPVSPTCSGVDSSLVPVGAAPGAPAFSEDLSRRLAVALAGKGADYRPRTHHLRDDGSPEYTNRLILETSPYLLQHAHNPVNWYSWGDEAFEMARALGRPVLLSIGYSTCHWCHVMEEESFEDVEIATYLNENYIAIKVDREERPDVDGVYMSAVQMLTGRGGWPMTTWLTPDRQPFWGGTYFPARDGDRGSRIGFLTLLKRMKESYDQQPEQVVGKAREIADRIQSAMAPQSGPSVPAEKSLATAVRGYKSGFDAVHGGRRQAPKFPSSLPVRLLLWRHWRTGDPELLEMARLTLRKMAGGGMYDQVGGGFHRYSVDAKWLVPHFEKMLYDNALLAVQYLEGYQLTGDDDLARVAREILRYVGREMTSPDGAFFSATDADSRNPEGEIEEGWFFTWTPAEIRAVLGEDAARKVEAYYGVTAAGNFEGRNILHVERPLEEIAVLLGVPAERLAGSLESSREKLYAARAGRPAPLLDDKILAAWNGLMISAMARGGFILDDPDLISRAARAADFVLTRMREEGRLLRSFKDGAARHAGYLDDYAFVTAGLLDLYEATGEVRWIKEAVALQRELDEHYRDGDAGGYFMTADDREELIAREKPAYDGAEPSGNSVALMNLVRLRELTTDDRYRVAVDELLQGFGAVLGRRPAALPQMLLALEFDIGAPKEIVLVTAGPRENSEPFLDVLRGTFVPNKVVAVVSDAKDGSAQTRFVPIAKGKVARGGLTTAYVCERGICKLPTSDVGVFSEQLMQRSETHDDDTPQTP